jgi:hypothetical protein
VERYIITFGEDDAGFAPGSTESLDDAVETARRMSEGMTELRPDLDGAEVRVWLCQIDADPGPLLIGEPVARFRDGHRTDDGG